MLGIYEACCLKTLFDSQIPINLYNGRSGDGHCIAIENLLRLGYISEDNNKNHFIIKNKEDECTYIIDYWFK